VKKLFIGSTLSAALLSSAAYAVEVTGGYLDLGYSTFTDSDFGDRYNFNGSGEVAFSRMFSVQLDIGGYRFADLGETATNVTLHTNLHTSGNASFGAFYGQDSLDDADFQFYGVEAGFDAGPATIEGYLGYHELDDFSGVDGTLFGISAVSELGDDWEFLASYDYVADFLGGIDTGVFALSAKYLITDQAEVYGEIGTTHFSLPFGSTNEAFVAIGVRMNFGNSRGTTFGRRGVFAPLAGLPGIN